MLLLYWATFRLIPTNIMLNHSRCHIHLPTHIAGNNLDLVITDTNHNKLTPFTRLFSDHRLVHFYTNSPKIIRPIHSIKFRKYDNLTSKSFIEILSSIYNNTKDYNINSKLELFPSETIEQLDPINSKNITIINMCRRFNDELSTSKRFLRSFEKISRKLY